MAENSTSTQVMKTKINEVYLDNQQIDNDTEAVMKQRVAKSTRGATKEATSHLYFGCLTTITNTPLLCNLRSTI